MAGSISTTAAELRSLALASVDRRGHFTAMYARVTARIATAIDDGRFADSARMDEFATAFARLFLAPATGSAPAPRCWRAAWDVAGDDRLLIVQHLLLGINAHVNHDLPLAVVEVATRRGDLASTRPDFDAVNRILAETYEELLSDLGLVSRWATAASRLGGGDAFNFSLRVARDQAWRAAVVLHGLDDAARGTYQAELDRLVAVLAHQVTRPPAPVRPLVWLARRFEHDDPSVVTRRLLGP